MQDAASTTQFRLGIDFGTSQTTAILRWPDGHTRPLLFDGSPLLPSAVYAEPGHQLLVGRDAIHAARLDPARFEPTPKRRIGEAGAATLRLGDQEVEQSAMVAAVLARVRDEAVRVSGGSAAGMAVTMTHPVAWGPERTLRLTEAARLAGLPPPRLVPEPVAAAGYFSAVLGRTLAPGFALVVYDFGGGTFDVSVVAPADSGYVVLAVDGLPDLGGVDLDAALLRHVADTHRDEDPAVWQRLEEPVTAADRRHRRHLIEDIRTAKEMLSRTETATVPIPLLEREARITRAEFEELARPMLDRTIRTTIGVIAAADLQPGRIAAVLLVGGSSRIPLVAELLRSETSLEPATMDQPEMVVAEGSVRLAGAGTGGDWAEPPVAPAAASPAVPIPVEEPTTAPIRAAAGAAPRYAAAADPWATAERAATLGRVAAEAPTLVSPVLPEFPGMRHASGVAAGPGRPPVRARRWLIAVLAALAVLGLAAAAVIVAPGIFAANGGRGTTPTTSVTLGPTATTVPPTTPAPVARPNPPAWLPADFIALIDDATDPAFVDGPATHGGSCAHSAPGVIDVKRYTVGVTGCVGGATIKAASMSDSAVEARFRVGTGCGGMWLRTGTKGYFVAVCADATVSLHRLANRDPEEANRLGQWTPDFDPHDVVVGVLAQGTELTVIINGVTQSPVSDDTISNGHVAVGGYAPGADGVDATITGFKAWRLP